jgi:hypothetical protein
MCAHAYKGHYMKKYTMKTHFAGLTPQLPKLYIFNVHMADISTACTYRLFVLLGA